MDEEPHIADSRIVYDRSAQRYVEAIGVDINEQCEASLDRAMLEVFATELARSASGIVLDVGCGPGRVAAFLANTLGNHVHDIRGVDLAPAMIAAARAAHPHLRFEVGSLTHLNVPSGSVVGAAYWYSIITTPIAELHHVWTELDRVLAPGGEVLIAFQAGADSGITRTDASGSGATLTLYQHAIESVVATLTARGFEVVAQAHRMPQFAHETHQQAFLVARRAMHAGG